MASTKQNVTVIGLGPLGIAFAHRAQKLGHTVIGWNRTPGRGSSAAVPEAADAIAAVKDANVVLIVVADNTAVESICSDAFLGALNDNAILAIVSTVAPEVVRSIATRRPSGLVIDTPVLGVPAAIEAGEGTFLVGGPVSSVKLIAPLLDDLGAGYTHCGDVGSGEVMKLVSNYQIITGIVALGDAVAIARSQGIEDALLRQTFGNSIAVSETSKRRLELLLKLSPNWVSNPMVAPFRAIGAKDVGLAVKLAEEAGLPASMGSAVLEMLR